MKPNRDKKGAVRSRGRGYYATAAELTAAAMNLPEARLEKVQALKHLIDAGKFQVPPKKIALMILNHLQSTYEDGHRGNPVPAEFKPVSELQWDGV